MPQSVKDQIALLKKALANWDTTKIDRVRHLERPTMLVPQAERKEGYVGEFALQGFRQQLDAYALLDGELTDGQQAKLAKASLILQGLESDMRAFGYYWSPEKNRQYTDMKMRELEEKGEIYLNSGYTGRGPGQGSHFAIVKIVRTPAGYTCTEYNAGGEAHDAGWQNDRIVVNAVQENAIRSGTDMREFIKANIIKQDTPRNSPERNSAVKLIENALVPEPLFVKKDFGQRRGNCTTRSQRVLLDSILDDEKLSDNIRDFITDDDNAADVKAILQRRLAYLRNQERGKLYNPLSPHSPNAAVFAKAANPRNYEYAAISLKKGGEMYVYRTKPTAFTESELRQREKQMRDHLIDAKVQESVSKPGFYYLYVRPEDARKALQIWQDEKPVWRRLLTSLFGEKAEQMMPLATTDEYLDPSPGLQGKPSSPALFPKVQ